MVLHPPKSLYRGKVLKRSFNDLIFHPLEATKGATLQRGSVAPRLLRVLARKAGQRASVLLRGLVNHKPNADAPKVANAIQSVLSSTDAAWIWAALSVAIAWMMATFSSLLMELGICFVKWMYLSTKGSFSVGFGLSGGKGAKKSKNTVTSVRENVSKKMMKTRCRSYRSFGVNLYSASFTF